MTLFPDMFDRVFDQSIIGRAKDKGLLELHCHQIREYTKNKQMQVDDYPYGGGQGMLMQCDTVNDSTQKLALLGSLTLYLDFVNLFLYLLRFLGNRK